MNPILLPCSPPRRVLVSRAPLRRRRAIVLGPAARVAVVEPASRKVRGGAAGAATAQAGGLDEVMKSEGRCPAGRYPAPSLRVADLEARAARRRGVLAGPPLRGS